MTQEDATIENNSSIDAYNNLHDSLILEKMKEHCTSFDLDNSNVFDDNAKIIQKVMVVTKAQMRKKSY